MLILETGKTQGQPDSSLSEQELGQKLNYPLAKALSRPNNKLQGFSLIEVMIVLVIIGMIVGLSRLALPNNEKRLWENETQQLVGILNQANDESTLLGISLEAVIDSQGWRFYRYSAQSERVLMQDILAEHRWDSSLTVKGSYQFLIGDISSTDMLPINLTNQVGDSRSAQIIRERNGHFLLIK